MVPRVPDWRERLDAVVFRYGQHPFIWGEYDCGHWAADCVEALTGADVLGTLRGCYDSRLGCYARLRHRGFRNATEAADGLLAKVGAARIDPRAAIIGDLAATPCHTMVVRLQGGFMGRGEHGEFRMLGAKDVRVAWSIGR
jgi:hypothetical protein